MKFKSRFHGYEEIRELEGPRVCLLNEILGLRIPKGSMSWPRIHTTEWNKGKSP